MRESDPLPLTADQESAIRAGLSAALTGDMPGAFLVIVETMDPQTGEPMLETLIPDSATQWQVMGFIEFARRLMYASPEQE